jgi:hypothetical protein
MIIGDFLDFSFLKKIQQSQPIMLELNGNVDKTLQKTTLYKFTKNNVPLINYNIYYLRQFELNEIF